MANVVKSHVLCCKS